MIAAADDWKERINMQFAGSFTVKMNAAAECYVNCCIHRATNYPALLFYETPKDGIISQTNADGIVTENLCWERFEQCMSDLLEMLDEGESTGVYSPTRLKCYTFLLLYRWLSSARQHLTVAYHWGDMQRSGPRRLLEEIRIVFQRTNRERWNEAYAGTYFATTNDMSIDDIDDYSRSRKRKRNKDEGLALEPECITGTHTPVSEDRDAVEDISGTKKRRRNPDGSSSAAEFSSATATVGSSVSSRRRGKVTAATQALSEIDISGEGDVGSVIPSSDVSVTTRTAEAPKILESSFVGTSKDISLNVLRPLMKFNAEIIPEALLRIIDFHVRALLLLSNRIEETQLWSDKLSALQEQMKKTKSKAKKEGVSLAVNVTGAAAVFLEDDDYKAMMTLSEEAEVLDLCCAKRDALTDQLKQVFDWANLSDSLLAGRTSETVEKLQQHVKLGEKLHFNFAPITALLKAALRDANTWISKYEELCGEDDGNGGVSNMRIKELMELLPASESIKGVDLSDYTSYIQRVGEVYCVCRIATHGVMIECEHCSDWYHNECLSLSSQQIEKYEADQFKCPRCVLVDSFYGSAKVAADLVSLWMNPEQLEKNKQNKIARLERRFAKCQKDSQSFLTEKIHLLASHENIRHALLMISAQSTVPQTGSIAPSVVALPPGEVPTVDADPVASSVVDYTGPQPAQVGTPVSAAVAGSAAQPVSGPTLHDLALCESALREVELKIAQAESNRLKIGQERHEFYASRIVGDPGYQAVVRGWASDVSQILWPEDPEEIARGHPIKTSGLPIALQEVIERSYTLNINSEIDVQEIIISLQTMNWYYRALCTLQSPPTTNTLRQLLSDPCAPKNHVDKSVKFLSSTLHRAKYVLIAIFYDFLSFDLCML